jgi:hypothetical protein
MVYTNYKLFKDLNPEEDDAGDAGNLLKKVNAALNAEKPFDDIHKQIYDELRTGKTDQKAEFALDLIYAIDPGKLTIPPYIAEGLEWLQTILRPEEC